jgi:hypothetical protein
VKISGNTILITGGTDEIAAKYEGLFGIRLDVDDPKSLSLAVADISGFRNSTC